ncbi:MAG: hypothetical protein ACLTYN_17420 [Dysosmobacter welbionis]
MRIDIMTLFPDSVDAMLNVSILGRAQQRGYISIQSHQIRQYTTNRQMQVDDYPYGGGRGAVMQADPCTAAGATSWRPTAPDGRSSSPLRPHLPPGRC